MVEDDILALVKKMLQEPDKKDLLYNELVAIGQRSITV